MELCLNSKESQKRVYIKSIQREKKQKDLYNLNLDFNEVF